MNDIVVCAQILVMKAWFTVDAFHFVVNLQDADTLESRNQASILTDNGNAF